LNKTWQFGAKLIFQRFLRKISELFAPILVRSPAKRVLQSLLTLKDNADFNCDAMFCKK